jgi:predicted ATPase
VGNPTLKRQAIQDSWRRVAAPVTKIPAVTHVSIDQLDGFRQSQWTVDGLLQILCGPNGSGKTRLLAAIAVQISNPGTGELSINTDGRSASPTRAHYFDVGYQLHRQLSSITADHALHDRIAQAPTKSVGIKDLALLNFVLGDVIEQAFIYELDDTESEIDLETQANHRVTVLSQALRSDVIPYFRIVRNGQTADSRELSRGELSVLTLYWLLESAESGELILLDEPDAYMSPLTSQRALVLLATKAGSRKTQCIVASHSYLGLSTAPPDLLRLIERQPDDLLSIQSGAADRLWQALQVAPPIRHIFAVEDEAGRQWLHLLFRLSDFDSAYAAIWNVGGDTNVRRAGAFPDSRESTIHMWGVLDGDERAEKKSKVKQDRPITVPSRGIVSRRHDYRNTYEVAVSPEWLECNNANNATITIRIAGP